MVRFHAGGPSGLMFSNCTRRTAHWPLMSPRQLVLGAAELPADASSGKTQPSSVRGRARLGRARSRTAR